MDFKQATDKATAILAKSSMHGNAVSSYGVFGDKKEVAHLQTICHASMQSIKTYVEESSWYYSAFRTGNILAEETQGLAMFGEYIIGDESPWRVFTKDRDKTLLVDDGKVLGFLIKLDPEDDANVVTHMSIAARIPQEHIPSYQIFLDLVKEGVAYDDALYLCSQFKKSGEKQVVRGGFIGMGHSCFNNPILDFKRFSTGNPRIENKRPISKLGYSNVNAIFDLDYGKRINLKPMATMLESNTSIKGRWTTARVGVEMRDVIDLWEKSYKNDLLKLAA